ncbi:tetratricopeptide repeat protein [Nannocystis pusilla]|uniref:tetratricopeptide repeat protein n=1 Tax=Nannocystis pusilla TaxID=889268 RepID=UPI003B7EB1D9
MVASSWRHMAMVAATEAPDLAAGRQWLRRADAASARVGLDASTAARLEATRGGLSLLAREFDLAVQQLRSAEAALTGQSDLLHASHAASNLGTALLERGEAGAAREAFERALEQRERVFGPRHPEVARAAYNLAQALRGPPAPGRTTRRWPASCCAGRWRSGRAPTRRGPWTPGGRRSSWRSSSSTRAGSSGQWRWPRTPRRCSARSWGRRASSTRRWRRCWALGTTPRPSGAGGGRFRRAVAGYAAAHGADDAYTASFRVALGWALLAAGEVAEARAELEAGRAAIEAEAGATREASADARLGLAAAELVAGEPARGGTAGRVRRGARRRARSRHLRAALGLVAARREPGGPQGAALLGRAQVHARAVAGGEAMLAVLLDSLGASASERRLAAG